jgi:phospholipase C
MSWWERALLGLVARFGPRKLRDPARMLAERPVPTPAGTVAVSVDESARRLHQIEHFVVVMLENRSFDHMLGYLSLPRELGGRGRGDVCGLARGMSNPNPRDRGECGIHHLDRTVFAGEAEDPAHGGADVEEQLAGGNAGFVANFASHSERRALAEQPPVPVPDPCLAMGYFDGDDLPTYDFLAANFTVCDRWFSSVPGATWPNRLYAVAGRADESLDDKPGLPTYNLPTVFRHLDDAEVLWRWYSFDPATLRLIDARYRLDESRHHHFSFVDKRKLSHGEEAVGAALVERPSFLDDAANGELAPVTWIDPHFKDMRMLGPDSSDDHPPADVKAGQDLIATIYHALCESPQWEKTMLLVTYDEHGGMFDHVEPPAAPDDDARFRRLGVRVPALVASPWVKARCDHTQFDHTSIIKTLLLRFCERDGQIPDMGSRVAAANHLGTVLESTPRAGLPDHADLSEQMVRWRTRFDSARYADAQALAQKPGRLNDLQNGLAHANRALRAAGLPAGHP